MGDAEAELVAIAEVAMVKSIDGDYQQLFRRRGIGGEARCEEEEE